jgi:iron complex outermembrane receptor protein
MSGTFAYSHVFTLANAATVSFEGSVKFAGARWLGIDFIPSERDGSYSLVDASLTYSAADNRWSVGVFGRNIADSVYYTGGIQTAFLGGVIGANIAPPRTYGIRGSFSFDATHR